MRTIIDLTEAQVARLEQVAAREEISRAEAARRAIDAAYPENDRQSSLKAFRQRAFGLWQGRGIDVVRYVDALRDEWLGPPKTTSRRSPRRPTSE